MQHYRQDKHLNSAITYRRFEYLLNNLSDEQKLFKSQKILIDRLDKNIIRKCLVSDYIYSGFQAFLIQILFGLPYERANEHSLYRSLNIAEQCRHPYRASKILNQSLQNLFQWKVWFHNTINIVSNSTKIHQIITTEFDYTVEFVDDMVLLIKSSSNKKINFKMQQKKQKNHKKYNENKIRLHVSKAPLVSSKHTKKILKKILASNPVKPTVLVDHKIKIFDCIMDIQTKNKIQSVLRQSVHCENFYLLTYEHLLNLSTIVHGLFNLKLYLTLCRLHKKESDKSFLNIIDELVAHIYVDLIITPVQTHKSPKMPTPIPTMLVIKKNRNDSTDQKFILHMEKDIFNFRNLKSLHFLNDIQIEQTRDFISVLELCGLTKIFGFPVIDVTKSCMSILEKGRNTTIPDSNLTESVCSFFKKEFIINYIKKEKKYPKFTSIHPGGDLEKMIINCDIKNLLCTHYQDFERITFDQTLIFDYCVDPTDLLSDKSIIQSLDQWIYEYKIHAYKSQYGRINLPSRKTKRLLIKYLCDIKTDVREIIENISNNNIDPQDNIIVMTFKEKELKIDNARGFGKMTYSRRLYQTCTEFNLKQSLFKYFPNQSMTMNENKLLNRLIELNYAMLSDSESYTVFMSFDFSSWCTTMNFDNTFKIFYEIDNLFGLKNVYCFSHILPYLCTFIIQDPYFPPKMKSNGLPEESQNSTNSYFKWIEGLRQKGWTILTMMFLQMVLFDLKIKSEFMGQGDNQVVILTINSRNKRDVSEMLSHLTEAISSKFEKIGLILKPEETWYSRFLFEYSKKYFYKGVEVPSIIKKVIRLGLDINNGIYTFSNSISSVFSSGISVAGCDVSPDIAYFMSIFEASFLLDQTTNGYLTMDKLIVSMLINRELGGYPIVNYTSFLMKGNMDPLTNALSLVKTLADNPLYSRIVLNFLNLEPSSKIDYLLLIKDPFSLNIRVPKQIENIIRNKLKNELPKIVKNENITFLYQQNIKLEEEKLIKDLISIRPCNPRLCNYLYKLSNVAINDKIISRFSNTRSLMFLIDDVEHDGTEVIYSFINSISHYDIQMIQEYNQRFENTIHYQTNKEIFQLMPSCSYEVAQLLRKNTWKIELDNITMPAVHECYTISTGIDTSKPSSSFLIYIDSSHEKYTNRGINKPYIGTNTKERVKKSNLEIIALDTVLKTIKKILKIKSWLNHSGNKNMNQLLDKLLQEKTLIDIEDLIVCQDVIIGGCFAHRLRDEVSPKGSMINSLSNFSTHIKVITDTALKFSKSNKDYTLCFQSMILSIISSLNLIYNFKGISDHILYSKIICDKCIHEITPDQCQLKDPPLYSGIDIKIKIEKISTKSHFNFIGIKNNSRYDISIIHSQKIINYINDIHNYNISEYTSHSINFLNISELVYVDIKLLLENVILHLIFEKLTDNHRLKEAKKYDDTLLELLMEKFSLINRCCINLLFSIIVYGEFLSEIAAILGIQNGNLNRTDGKTFRIALKDYMSNNILKIIKEKNHYRMTREMSMFHKRVNLKMYTLFILRIDGIDISFLLNILLNNVEVGTALSEFYHLLPACIENEEKIILLEKQKSIIKNNQLSVCSDGDKDSKNYIFNYLKFQILLNYYHNQTKNCEYSNSVNCLCNKSKFSSILRKNAKKMRNIHIIEVIKFYKNKTIYVDDPGLSVELCRHLDLSVYNMITDNNHLTEDHINLLKNFLDDDQLLNKIGGQQSIFDLSFLHSAIIVITRNINNGVLNHLRKMLMFGQVIVLIFGKTYDILSPFLKEHFIFFYTDHYLLVYSKNNIENIKEYFLPFPNLKVCNGKCDCKIDIGNVKDAIISVQKILFVDNWFTHNLIMNIIRRYNPRLSDTKCLLSEDLSLFADHINIQIKDRGLDDFLSLTNAGVSDLTDVRDFTVYFWSIVALMLGKSYYNPFNIHTNENLRLSVVRVGRGLLDFGCGLCFEQSDEGFCNFLGWRHLRDCLGVFCIFEFDSPCMVLSNDSRVLLKFMLCC
ncbi:TPA_asm: hypothetical protein [Girado virus 3]|nr:TPA_asm: hypothetical protein [Girado virus 3]